MKWCLINNLSGPNSRGGAEQVISRIIEKLVLNDEVVLISLTPGVFEKTTSGNLTDYKINPGFIYNYLNGSKQPWWKKIIWHAQNLYSRKSEGQLRQILLQEKPDIVWTHNLSGLGLQLPRLIRQLKFRHWHTLHDYQLIDPFGTLQRGIKLLDPQKWNFQIYAQLSQRLIKNPEVVMSPSQFCLDIHQALGFFKQSKKIAMPNPIILPFDIEPEDHRGVRFLYVGQVAEHKGIKVLLDAWSQIISPDCELRIIGGGDLLSLVTDRAQIDPRIKVLGKMSYSEIVKNYQASDCLIVPSVWWDNSPTVIYEASSYGLATIGSRAGGIPELVKDNVTGYLIKPGSVTALVQAINHVLDKPDQLVVMGQAAKEFIQPYAIDNFLNKIKQLYHEFESKN